MNTSGTSEAYQHNSESKYSQNTVKICIYYELNVVATAALGSLWSGTPTTMPGILYGSTTTWTGPPTRYRAFLILFPLTRWMGVIKVFMGASPKALCPYGRTDDLASILHVIDAAEKVIMLLDGL